MNLSTLNVGDRVSVAYNGSWSIRSQGIYIVTKINKVRITLQREGDGYERKFSVKTGAEIGSDRYRSAYIESIQDKENREAAALARGKERQAWENAELAATNKDISALRKALRELEERAWLK
jgi:hypothetical protein